MKILLVLAEHPAAADEVRAGMDANEWRVVQRTEFLEGEPMLAHGLAHACILDCEPNVKGLWKLDQLRKWAPHCPVIVCAENPPSEWIEEAYAKGAFHVIPKPLRSRLVAEVLQRIGPNRANLSSDTSFTVLGPTAASQAPVAAAAGSQALALLRGFSGILTHSLDTNGLLRQFLLFVRELFGLNKVIIFLPAEGRGSTSKLRAACSIGVPHAILEAFELSFDSGIGLLVSRTGRIVRRQSSQLSIAPEAVREFEVLGAEVAVPVPDRENVVGIALVDARITGEPLSNAELELLFHLLEQLGLGLKNISLHDQLAGNSRMLAGVLRELSSGCMVIGRDLEMLHANKMARKFFPPPSQDRPREIGFEDLPGELGAKVYQVLHTGTAVVNYRYEPKDRTRVFLVNIVPFQSQQDGSVSSVLLMLEDLTQAEHMRKLELEAAELKLIRPMADRLSSEIGNAIVPIPVFAQLLGERFSDAGFRGTMHDGLMDASRRIERLVNQMRFLIVEIRPSDQPFALKSLLEESFQEAGKHQPAAKSSKLKLQEIEDSTLILGDRGMLKHAFMEIMLNALQSAKSGASITVQAGDNEDAGRLQLEFLDNGEGFTPEAARRAAEPFFTTKTVGVGLGLAVAKRVIDAHSGDLEIPAPGKAKGGTVIVVLPIARASEKRKRG